MKAGFVFRSVASRARAAASPHGLTAMPASRHSRGRWIRTIALCVCLATAAWGVKTGPAAPVPLGPYDLTAALFTPVYSGGDLTGSVTLPYSASDINSFSAQIAAPALGLSEGAGPTPVVQALERTFESSTPLPSSITGVPQPPILPSSDNNGVTTTVTVAAECTPCATVTVTANATTVSDARVGASGAITWIVAMAGLYGGIAACGLFAARGLPTTPPPGQSLFQQFVANRPGAWATCSAIGYFTANLIELPVNNLWLGQSLKPALLASAISFAILQGANSRIQPNVAAWFATWAGALTTSIFPLGTGIFSSMSRYFSGGTGQAAAQAMTDIEMAIIGAPLAAGAIPQFVAGAFPRYLPGLDQAVQQAENLAFLAAVEAQFPAFFPVAEGTIYDPALFLTPDACADGGYGTSQPLIPGNSTIAAFNVCNSNPNQQWVLYGSPTASADSIQPAAGVPVVQIVDNGLCLAPINETNFGQSQGLILQWCSGSAAQNWWAHNHVIQNGGSGLCLDDPAFSRTPGTQLIDFPCNNQTNQVWKTGGAAMPTGPTAIAAGTITDGYAGSTGNCLDAYGSSGGASSGQIAAINVCNGNPAQNLIRWSDGTITDWGLCLNIKGNSTAQGTLVDFETCNGTGGQAWAQQGDGALLNPQSGLCLDDPFSNTSPGTQLWIWGCDNTAAQVWTLPGDSAPAGPAPPPPAPSGTLPCDIYASVGTPCVGAYSTVRAVYSAYAGPLYQVQRASDASYANIGLLSTGGDVNAAAQDSFCANTSCTITQIYDQSPEGNNLTIAANDHGASATALPMTIGGHKAYGLDIEPATGYRDNSARGTAVNGQPEGMYMVASGTHVNAGCCFDFGNMETNSKDNGNGHMDAVNLTTECVEYPPCTGSGPWVQVDMENGQFLGGNGNNPNNLGNSSNFVTALAKNNGQTTYAIKGGDSQSGGLSTWYAGPLPTTPGYAPMHQEGAIGLGTGGDNSNADVGSWFEGVITAGYPSDAADSSVQASIVSAGYGGSSNPIGGGGGGSVSACGTCGTSDVAVPSAAGQAVVHSAGGTGCGAAGFSSVYTVDAANGHLQETYLPCMGQPWNTQDLSANYGTPPVMAGTQPVALVHCGYTSVYTVDTNGDLQETYLSAIGNPWGTQDLSVKYGTPQTSVTPTAVEHGTQGSSTCGFTSVYTVDNGSRDLQETYLSNNGFPGNPWATQNLSVNYGTPPVMGGTSPVSITHCGFTSVFTVDSGSGQLQETYLPNLGFPGDPWHTQSLSVNYGTPTTNTTPTAVVHLAGATNTSANCGWTSVYTVDAVSHHLDETYLSNIGFPGDSWQTQDLSQRFGTPPTTARPEAVVHMGFTSVYTIDGSGDLQETYLPAIGSGWGTQDLSLKYGTPTTNGSPIVLVHPDNSGNLDWTSVFTVDGPIGSSIANDLQETYLPNVGFPGDPWITQNLSAKYGTPLAVYP